jgi:hypothetical protein
MAVHANFASTMEETMQHIHDVTDSEFIHDLTAKLKKATDPEDVDALSRLIERTKARQKRLTLDPNSALCREAQRKFVPTQVVLDGVFIAKMNGRFFLQKACFVAQGAIHVGE